MASKNKYDDYIDFSLEKNAYSSLNECLSNLNHIKEVSDYKHAMLHASLFIELILKLIVQNIHPLLIYSNVFRKKITNNLDKETTFGTDEIVQFIINDISIKNNSRLLIKNIITLKQMRNRIMHSSFKYRANDIENIIDQSLFEINELCIFYNLALIDKISNILKKSFTNRINGYSAKIRLAVEQAHKKAEAINSDNQKNAVKHEQYASDEDVSAIVCECPSCYNETFLINIDVRTGECTNTICNHKEDVGYCMECENFLPHSNLSEAYRGKLICECCITKMHDDFWNNKENITKLFE